MAVGLLARWPELEAAYGRSGRSGAPGAVRVGLIRANLKHAGAASPHTAVAAGSRATHWVPLSSPDASWPSSALRAQRVSSLIMPDPRHPTSPPADRARQLRVRLKKRPGPLSNDGERASVSAQTVAPARRVEETSRPGSLRVTLPHRAGQGRPRDPEGALPSAAASAPPPASVGGPHLRGQRAETRSRRRAAGQRGLLDIRRQNAIHSPSP